MIFFNSKNCVFLWMSLLCMNLIGIAAYHRIEKKNKDRYVTFIITPQEHVVNVPLEQAKLQFLNVRRSTSHIFAFDMRRWLLEYNINHKIFKSYAAMKFGEVDYTQKGLLALTDNELQDLLKCIYYVNPISDDEEKSNSSWFRYQVILHMLYRFNWHKMPPQKIVSSIDPYDFLYCLEHCDESSAIIEQLIKRYRELYKNGQWPSKAKVPDILSTVRIVTNQDGANPLFIFHLDVCSKLPSFVNHQAKNYSIDVRPLIKGPITKKILEFYLKEMDSDCGIKTFNDLRYLKIDELCALYQLVVDASPNAINVYRKRIIEYIVQNFPPSFDSFFSENLSLEYRLGFDCLITFYRNGITIQKVVSDEQQSKAEDEYDEFFVHAIPGGVTQRSIAVAHVDGGKKNADEKINNAFIDGHALISPDKNNLRNEHEEPRQIIVSNVSVGTSQTKNFQELSVEYDEDWIDVPGGVKRAIILPEEHGKKPAEITSHLRLIVRILEYVKRFFSKEVFFELTKDLRQWIDEFERNVKGNNDSK